MVSAGRKLWFRLGLLAALVSVGLSAYVVAHAQTGPSWEVPVAVVMELRTFPPIALALAAVALVLHFATGSFAGIDDRARRWFAVALVLAFVYPVVIWLFKPDQWAFRYESLSFIAMIQVVPVWIGAVAILWLAGFWWLRRAKPEAAATHG